MYVLLLLQLGKLRDQFVNLIQTEHQVQQHKGALQQLWGSYQPSLDKTDFGETMQEHLQQVQAGNRCGGWHMGGGRDAGRGRGRG